MTKISREFFSMLIKIIGSLFIFMSSSLFGVYNVLRIKFHVSNLKKIVNALEILQSELKFITPLEQATKNISDLESDFFIKEFFLNIYLCLKKKSDCAQNIWLEQINLLSQKIYIDREDILTIKTFAQVISSADNNLQISYLKKIILSIENKIIFLEKNYQTQKKLYFNLGILFGLLIIIVFI